MGDEKKTENLDDIAGGPKTDGTGVADPLADVDGGFGHHTADLSDVDGGAFPTAPNVVDPLDDVDGGADATDTGIVNPQITD